jgi:BirA family transcriptional regulator, biotin operon repressor / biotin---[acetyl-CoA-carboxylase] ligase
MMPPREVWSLDTRRLGRRILVFDRLDSTNNLAAQLADDPGNNGLVVLTDEQSAGRGQHGRRWLAPSGQSVLLSVVISPPAALCRPVLLTAWAAVAVCATIAETIHEEPRIKWPNDVLLNGRKVCGILIESTAGSELTSPRFIVGIGLNVQQRMEDFAANGLPDATSLKQFTHMPLETRSVALHLIHQLDRGLDLLCQGELVSLETRWKERLGLLGKNVIVECHSAIHHGKLMCMSFHKIELALEDAPPLVLTPERIRHLRGADE